MRSIALLFVAVSSIALASCAHKPKPEMPPEDISAPAPAPQANDGVDKVDPTQAPQQKKGFFYKKTLRISKNSNVVPPIVSTN